MDAIKIAPSLLAADFGHLEQQIAAAEQGGADLLHLDVMDGHFVPNLSFGACVIGGLRPLTNLPFDVHLMISNPAAYLDGFLAAGANSVTIHTECESDIGAALAAIRMGGAHPALAINPETPLSDALPYRDQIDMLLIMSVHPGFGGQSYLAEVEDKMREARTLFGPGFDIEVDGGIYPANISNPVSAGANVIVAGSAVFGSDDIAGAIAQLRAAARRSTQN